MFWVDGVMTPEITSFPEIDPFSENMTIFWTIFPADFALNALGQDVYFPSGPPGSEAECITLRIVNSQKFIIFTPPHHV